MIGVVSIMDNRFIVQEDTVIGSITTILEKMMSFLVILLKAWCPELRKVIGVCIPHI